MARNLVLHLLYSFINKGVAKEECGISVLLASYST